MVSDWPPLCTSALGSVHGCPAVGTEGVYMPLATLDVAALEQGPEEAHTGFPSKASSLLS